MSERMKRHHHKRPHDVELETAEHRLLAEELRYLRHLVRAVGLQLRHRIDPGVLRSLDPDLMAAWDDEVRQAERETGYLDEPDNPLE